MDWKNLRLAILEMIPMIGLFFAPAYWIIIIVLLLMGADTYHGVRASRFERKEWSTSRFSDFFAKLLGYGFFITIGLLVDKEANIHYGVWLSAIIPIFTEVRSIDENQRRQEKKGIIRQAEEVYKFALRIKKKRDGLR